MFCVIFCIGKVAWIEATNPESDKKQKKKRKKDSRTKYQVAGKLGKKKEPKDTSIAKIPSVKEWAKQEEKKRKAEEKRQKKELEKDKKKQKEMEKRIAKANKLKKDQQKKEDREIKKARKATAKAEKAAAKAKKVTDKADAKRMKKRSKLEVRLNKQLKDSDEQMAAYLEKQKELVKERKKRREDKSREMLNEIAKAEETIKSLQEKVERKERKVAQLGERRSKSGDTSILVAFTLNYKIKEYQQRIYSIKSVITKLKEKIEAKKKEVEQLAPHLLEMGESTETQNFGASESICGNSEVADDDKSILDMLCGLDSDSECSDDEVEELAAPKEICVQDALQKAQESLQKMDEVGLSGSCSLAGDKEPSCTYEGKGKGPANGKETVKKCLSIVNQLTMTI